jgi:hypothetical protein
MSEKKRRVWVRWWWQLRARCRHVVSRRARRHARPVLLRTLTSPGFWIAVREPPPSPDEEADPKEAGESGPQDASRHFGKKTAEPVPHSLHDVHCEVRCRREQRENDDQGHKLLKELPEHDNPFLAQ